MLKIFIHPNSIFIEFSYENMNKIIGIITFYISINRFFENISAYKLFMYTFFIKRIDPLYKKRNLFEKIILQQIKKLIIQKINNHKLFSFNSNHVIFYHTNRFYIQKIFRNNSNLFGKIIFHKSIN